MTTLKQTFGAMFAQYDQLTAQIKGANQDTPEANPVKREWAAQEGYRPTYNPNSNSTTWVQQPQPVYQQSQVMNLQGSMSPERLVESFPAFAWKAENADQYITEIINQVLNGQITTQRAKEMLFQFALEAFDEAWKEGSGTGAAKNATSFAEALESASKSNKVAGK